MARQYLTGIDLNKNEILNARVQNLASAPSSPVTGQIYYDTSTSKLYFWDGTSWVAASGSSGFTQEQIEDFIATMLTAGTQTGITLTYNDGVPSVDFVVGALHTLPAPTGSLSLNSQKITNLATPTASTDGATKGYVDSAINGTSWKNAARVATTAAGTLASSFENGDSVDGVTLATGDRILIKNQGTASENGLYVVNASGAPTRASDADTAAELPNMAVFIEEGTVNADTAWVLTTNAPITVGSTSLTYAQFAGAGSYVAGNGLDLTGNTFSVNVDNSTIEINADALRVKDGGISDAKLASTFTKKYATNVGDGTSTTITVTHGLGSRDVTVSVHDNSSPYAEVYPEIQKTSTTQVSLVFATAPASSKYRCVVVG